MSSHSLVSIVTPAYNQADFLIETIESVLAQSYPNIEYIVLDDGSTDATSDILARYDGKIRWQRHDNMGQARTLNKGWAMSNGEIIGYLSSDDILYPGAVQKIVEIVENDKSVVCAFPDSALIDDKSRIIKKNLCRPFSLSELVIRQECYIGPGALFRRAAFDSVGGWKSELKLAPDREFWIRLADCGNFEFCHEILAGYRMHPRSISYKDVSEEISREYIRVLDDYYSRPSLSLDFATRKSEAYGYAHLILARNSFRSGRFRRGWQLYKEACRLHPPLSDMEIKASLVKNIVSKPIRVALSAIRPL